MPRAGDEEEFALEPMGPYMQRDVNCTFYLRLLITEKPKKRKTDKKNITTLGKVNRMELYKLHRLPSPAFQDS